MPKVCPLLVNARSMWQERMSWRQKTDDQETKKGTRRKNTIPKRARWRNIITGCRKEEKVNSKTKKENTRKEMIKRLNDWRWTKHIAQWSRYITREESRFQETDKKGNAHVQEWAPKNKKNNKNLIHRFNTKIKRQ